jgi:hypothetical protein
MESSKETPQKTKTRTTIQSSNTAPRHTPKDGKSGYNRDTCTPVFIAALLTIAKLWKQPGCPTTNEWIKKMCYMYLQCSIIQP